MRRTSTLLLSILVIPAVLFAARSMGPPPAAQTPAAQAKTAIDQASLKAFAPLPDAVSSAKGAASDDLVNLGRMLFFEPRLSKSQKISCNSCHDLATYGMDGQPTSDGYKGQKGSRNAPTVYNAAAHFAQFWDGRAPDVEAQAKGPVLNPIEMAMPAEAQVIAVLGSMPEYVAAFERAFPGDQKPVTYDNMALAIGGFERRLMTPSRWDALLEGDQNALTPAEKAGFRTFVGMGCQACHGDALLGGTMYQRLGIAKSFPRSADPGRIRITNVAADVSVFKVPSLRNVEKTGPYFHDGRTGTLSEAIGDMAEYQLGRNVTDRQVAEIADFLKALTGKIDPAYIKPPALPKSTALTPKPDER